MSKKHIKVFTAFSGYDSQCIALDELAKEYPDKFSYELIGWSEIDPYAIKTHNIFFPQYADRNYGDISKVDWKDVEDFDLLTYSSPCFPAGTMVRTKNGSKSIETVEVGEEVLTHTGEYKKVLEVMKTDYSQHNFIFKVVANAKKVVYCTAEHPFYVHIIGTEDKYEWVMASELDSSKHDLTYFYNEEMFWAVLNSVEIKKTKCDFVYNLEVEDNHSYTANDFIVHNCTDFSLAGARAGGEEGSGTRSSLLWEVKRCIEAKKPKYLLLENVTGLVNGKFRPLFDKWCKTVENYGYENFWSVLNAKEFGVPQNRDRVFLVSIRKDRDDEIINYNFPNKMDTNPQIEDILETDRVDEKYYVNQEKVDQFVKENEEMIINHIKTRNKL